MASDRYVSLLPFLQAEQITERIFNLFDTIENEEIDGVDASVLFEGNECDALLLLSRTTRRIGNAEPYHARRSIVAYLLRLCPSKGWPTPSRPSLSSRRT